MRQCALRVTQMWFKESNVQYNGDRRLSARAIIIRDGNMLVFRRKRFDREEGAFLEYYSIPGGGVDNGENIEDACVRELKEEMGVDIELKAKVAVKLAPHHENHVFYAEITSGEPHFMNDSEEARIQNDKNQFEVQWVPVDQLTRDNLLFYRDFLPVIQAIARGEVPSEPVQLAGD